MQTNIYNNYMEFVYFIVREFEACFYGLTKENFIRRSRVHGQFTSCKAH